MDPDRMPFQGALIMSQLFTQAHYDTFVPPKPDNDDDRVRIERELVRDQFIWLDDQLAPFIKDKGLPTVEPKSGQSY
jgi:hypothetical protein